MVNEEQSFSISYLQKKSERCIRNMLLELDLKKQMTVNQAPQQKYKHRYRYKFKKLSA